MPVHDDRILFELREAYREAFLGFDPARVARFTPARIEQLLTNPGIVRNRLKIGSTVGNAKSFLAIQHEFGSFDTYVWSFVGGTPRVKFVGSTICYAFMQAVGMVNDHTTDCFRYERVGKRVREPLSSQGVRPSAAGATMRRRG